MSFPTCCRTATPSPPHRSSARLLHRNLDAAHALGTCLKNVAVQASTLRSSAPEAGSACLRGALSRHGNGRDARSSQVGCPRHCLSDTLSGSAQYSSAAPGVPCPLTSPTGPRGGPV